MIKITVLQRALFSDIIANYSVDPISACDMFTDGQIFILDSIDDIPAGFCSWAWADIQRDIAMVAFGAHPEPKLKKANSIISCCTEGLRPVVFLIESIRA